MIRNTILGKFKQLEFRTSVTAMSCHFMINSIIKLKYFLTFPGLIESFGQRTVGSYCKNPPKTRFKNSSATVWQILNVKRRQPETEVMWICRKFHAKTREITLDELMFWRIFELWNHCVAWGQKYQTHSGKRIMNSKMLCVFLVILIPNSIHGTFYKKRTQFQSYFTPYPMLARIGTDSFANSDLLPLYVDDICDFNSTLKTNFENFEHFNGTENPYDNLLCIAQHESTFNYKAVGNKNQNPNSTCYRSKDFGIWQFSECYWCNSNKEWKYKSACGRDCTDFLDRNLLDDIECFKIVFSEKTRETRSGIKGFTPWTAWKDSCRCEAGKKLVCPKTCDRKRFFCSNKFHCVDI